eukprot:270334-Amphidinium_carterae.1
MACAHNKPPSKSCKTRCSQRVLFRGTRRSPYNADKARHASDSSVILCRWVARAFPWGGSARVLCGLPLCLFFLAVSGSVAVAAAGGSCCCVEFRPPSRP